jgi:hypothetical protein
MDPYLEHPSVWPDLHNRLIARLGDTLGPVLRPRYYVRLEERTYAVEGEGLLFAGRPDVTVADKGTSREASTREPTSAATIMEVEVPMPDEVRETYLAVRAAPTHEVVTVLEILPPANKRAGPGRELYTKKRLAVVSGTEARRSSPFPPPADELFGSWTTAARSFGSGRRSTAARRARSFAR